MRIFGTEIHELREPADQDERSRRLSELGEELAVARGKLRRAMQEQDAPSGRDGDSGFEAEWLRGELERLGIALGNLEREQRELLAEVG
jgi:hypothetical protein